MSLHHVEQAVAHAVTEVKEHHSSGTGNAAVAQQPFQNVNRDHMASRQLSANGTAPDRQVICATL